MSECEKEFEENVLGDTREQILMNMSPHGLARCLEKELENSKKELNFYNMKCQAIENSIEKLLKP